MRIERRLRREKLKQDYKKFCKQWNGAKEIQELRKKAGEKFGEGELQIVGRRPSFHEWKESLERMLKKAESQLDMNVSSVDIEPAVEWGDPTIPASE